MSYTPSGGFPDLATLRAEIGVPATQVPDDTLEKIAGAEQEGVNLSYEWPAGMDLPDRMYRYFIRAVARHVAAQDAPFGMIGTDSEFGVARLTTRDAEMVRLGGAFRKRTFA